MAKIIQKVFSFSDFRGIDLGRNDLSRDANAAIVAHNIVKGPTDSLETRRGKRPIGQYRYSTGSSNIRYPQWGIHTYIRTNLTTGETIQECVGMGNTFFRLVRGSCVIVYTGLATTATFDLYPSGGDWVADFKLNGVSASGFPLLCGVGGAVLTTLAQLRNAINAIAGAQCTLTPCAVVNGNQVNRDHANAVTVFNTYSATTQPHTFAISTTQPTRAELLNQATGFNLYADVIAQTATTITCKAESPSLQFNVNNLDEIGVGNYPAYILHQNDGGAIVGKSVKTTSVTFNFEYWEQVFNKTSISNSLTNEYSSNFQNFCFKNHSNNVYFGSPSQIGIESPTFRDNLGNEIILPIAPRPSGLFKYDGQSVYLAGVPRVRGGYLLVTVGAGLPAGTYKYIFRYKFIDKQNNIIFGTDTSDFSNLINLSAVTTAGVGIVTIGVNAPNFNSGFSGYNNNSAIVNGNQTLRGAGSPITVTAATHNMRVGDVAAIYDHAATPPSITRRNVTAITSTTISIDGAATISVKNGDYITANTTVEVYRTKVGGNIYYLQGEYPIAFPSVVVVDVITDAQLGIQYDGPFLGNRRKDLPPVVPIIENHQGLLVGAGDPANPETLYWCNFDSCENWPVGTGQTDLGGDDGGSLTCLVSDTPDMLATFKDDAYFNVVGDLDSGGYSVSAYMEGGMGCPSRHGAIHYRDSIMFMSNKGPRILKAGEIIDFNNGTKGYDDRLLPYFFNNFYTQNTGDVIGADDPNATKYVVRRIVGINDRDRELILFSSAPEIGTVGSTLRPNGPIIFAYDYRNDFWLTASGDHSGGATIYNNQVYSVSRVYDTGATAVGGISYRVPINESIYSYMDDAFPIPISLGMQWVFLNAPSIDKEFLRVKVYRFVSTFNGVNPDFDLRIETRRNFDLTTNDSLKTVTFVTGDIFKEMKLLSGKALSCALIFNTLPDFAPVVAKLSGYEFLISTSYLEEDISKQ